MSCLKPKTKNIDENDKYYVIEITEDVESGTSLYTYMLNLKNNGRFNFTEDNGMLTALNGISNKSDWSEAWMLYTTDEDNSNSAWGYVNYNEVTYASAMYGMKELLIKQGESYLWYYQSF
jgi:hypothetical protein